VRKEQPDETNANTVADQAKGERDQVSEPEGDSVPTTTANFFDRITNSTSHLQHSLQSTFHSTLASAANNPALSNPTQLRTQLAENLRLSSARENLQLSLKQAERLAEDYLKKGDQLVKDAEKWMGDAVRVLPPEGSGVENVTTHWDGGDWYSFTTSTTPSKTASDEHKDGPDSSRPVPFAASRKEALLRRLREDRDLLLVDPEGEEETPERRAEYKQWVEEQWRDGTGQARVEEGEIGSIRMALGGFRSSISADYSPRASYRRSILATLSVPQVHDRTRGG
jgi:hypothetical protein